MSDFNYRIEVQTSAGRRTVKTFSHWKELPGKAALRRIERYGGWGRAATLWCDTPDGAVPVAHVVMRGEEHLFPLPEAEDPLGRPWSWVN